MRLFKVCGPFPIPKKNFGILNSTEFSYAFWDTVNDEELGNNCGAYIFSIRNGNSFIPWYVGMTTKRYYDYLFGDRHLLIFQGLIKKHGEINIFLVGCKQCFNKSELSGKLSQDIIGLEKHLIENAYLVNPEIHNTRGIPQLDWGIKGIFPSQPGGLSVGTRILREMLYSKEFNTK